MPGPALPIFCRDKENYNIRSVGILMFRRNCRSEFLLRSSNSNYIHSINHRLRIIHAIFIFMWGWWCADDGHRYKSREWFVLSVIRRPIKRSEFCRHPIEYLLGGHHPSILPSLQPASPLTDSISNAYRDSLIGDPNDGCGCPFWAIAWRCQSNLQIH